MTALLLDTHTFVWAISAPHRLGEEGHRAIALRRTTVHVSSATAWEMAIKFRSGRWPEVAPVVADFAGMVGRLKGEQLPITAEHALRAGGLAWDHADPFDRMLAAQALATGATLVTQDAAFAGLGGLSVLW